MKLTVKQKKFCDEYIKSGNASDAARKAGYSPKTAPFTGSENLKKRQITDYISKKTGKINKDTIASQEEILSLMTSIIRGEMTEEQYISSPNGVEKVIKPPDIKERQKAMDSLLKRYPVSKNDKLRDDLLRLQVKKMEKELQSDTSTEDKLMEYFNKLDGVVNDDK